MQFYTVRNPNALHCVLLIKGTFSYFKSPGSCPGTKRSRMNKRSFRNATWIRLQCAMLFLAACRSQRTAFESQSLINISFFFFVSLQMTSFPSLASNKWLKSLLCRPTTYLWLNPWNRKQVGAVSRASTDCVFFCREYLGKQLQSTEQSTPAVAARSWTLPELLFASVDVVRVSVIAASWKIKASILFVSVVFLCSAWPSPNFRAWLM